MTSTDLFNFPPSLLSWLPGETLFSLVSRQHAFWGHPGAGETAAILFGRRHGGTHHDFPNELDELFARTDGVWGQPDELAQNHTLLCYYRPFSSQGLISDCLAMMRGKSVSHLKYRLGLLTSSFRANHPLKACTACMENDLSDVGWAYWHLEHQYPGVWYCERHGHSLHEATIKSTGVNRFLWALPDGRNLARNWLQSATDADSLQKMSSITLQLMRVSRGTGWLDGAHVVPVLREAIRQRGWMTSNGSLRTIEMVPSYLAWCKKLSGPTEFDSLPSCASEAASQVGRLLRPWRTGTHPLRLLVAIGWLFDDTDTFLAAHDRIHGPKDGSFTQEPSYNVLPLLLTTTDHEVNVQLVAHVRTGVSATAAANTMGVTVGTAMAWLAQAGVSVTRRPKTLKPEIQLSLKATLLQGLNKATTASTHGVSIQAVTRFLRTEPGLHQAWQGAVFLNRQASAHGSWAALVAADGHLGVKWLRAQEPAIYAWLYRNDRAWLQENLPNAAIRAAPTPRVKWDDRDLELSAAVEQAFERLKVMQPRRPLKLWQLYQAMPQLKPKLSALERLPLTRRAIERGLGRSKVKSAEDLL